MITALRLVFHSDHFWSVVSKKEKRLPGAAAGLGAARFRVFQDFTFPKRTYDNWLYTSVRATAGHLPTENSRPQIRTVLFLVSPPASVDQYEKLIAQPVRFSSSQAFNLKSCSSVESMSSSTTRIEHRAPHAVRYTQGGCRDMCSDPLDPGGGVCGFPVRCTLAMSDMSSRAAQ